MPRAYDRLIPPVDKDPNRFGTDYANPLEAVSDAAAVAGEQIRDQLVRIIMDKTGIDLSGPIEFINWLSAQINVTLGDLGATLLSLAAPIIDKVQEIIDAILAATGIDLSSPEDFLVWLAGLIGIDLRELAKNVQEMIDGLFNLFSPSGAVGKTVAEAVAAIQDWLTGVFQPVADGLAGVVKMIQDLLDGLFGLFGVSGATGKTPIEVITAIGTWLSGVFQPVSDGLAAIVKTVTDLINGLFGLFGGTGTVSLAGMITAATTWMTHWQEFVDGIWTAFSGGVAGVGKTVADALAAVTGWLGNVFQKLLDEIAKLWGWTPGAGGAAIHAGITDVIATISGILGIGQSAAVSAANANAGLAAIVAGQKGGFFDEFELPIANNLPATDWKKTSTLADSYGTDGNGSAVFHPSGTGLGWVEYVQISKPLLVPDMRCGVTLSKLPTWDLLVRSSWRIKVQCNPTDKACFQVQIANNQARFYAVDAAGSVTVLGAWQAIPPNAMGTQYELEVKGNVLTLYRGGIQAATYSGVTPMSGRCVGFGAEKVAYAGNQPCINLAGVSWRPVT